MVKLYYELIEKGLWVIDNVPLNWKSGVQTLLDADLD